MSITELVRWPAKVQTPNVEVIARTGQSETPNANSGLALSITP